MLVKVWLCIVLSCCVIQQVFATCQLRESEQLFDRRILLDDLAKLSAKQMSGRKTGSTGHAKARDYIQSRFQHIGLQSFSAHPEYFQHFVFSSSNSSGVNVIGWVKGLTLPEQFIVVTAHYDHLGQSARKIFYGADDNASGVATLLALAGKTVEQGLAHSVIFLATDAEEKGLYGAKAFVQKLPISSNALMLNINLDMLGYAGRKNRLYVTHTRGDKELRSLVAKVAEIAPICLINGHRKSQRFRLFDERINWRKASDHGAFAKAGFRYLFVGGGVHKNYHTPQDKFENIHQDFYVSATKTAWLILQAADTH